MATWSLRERPVWSLPGDGPHHAAQCHLEVEVHVLELRVPVDAPLAHLLLQDRESAQQLLDLRRRQQPGAAQAADMGRRPGQVLERQLWSTSMDRPNSAASASGASENRPPHAFMRVPPSVPVGAVRHGQRHVAQHRRGPAPRRAMAGSLRLEWQPEDA